MRIGVIGAGVVGVSAALALAGRGHEVTVFDREGVAAGASRGNAGAFAFTEIIPLATPGIMRKAPLWLFDPGGPLSIPPAYALRIAPWLAAFWRASLPGRYRAAVAAQSALMAHSAAALERLVAAHGLEDMLRRQGQLQLYEGEGEFRRSEREWRERREAGIRFELLESPAAIAGIQPGHFEGRVHLRNDHLEGTQTKSDAVLVDYAMAPTTIHRIGAGGSIGQYVDIDGAGFVGDEGLTLLRMSGQFVPEAAVGGGLALLRTGDRVRIDLNTRRVDVLLDEAELAQRRAAWTPPEHAHKTPWEEIYRSLVGQLGTGACLEPATLFLDIVATRGESRHSH